MFFDVHTHNTQSVNAINSFHFSEYINPEATCPHFSVGIHPWWAEDVNIDAFINYCEAHPKGLVAICECGIDKLKGPTIEMQQQLFDTQIQLATKLQLPIIVHMVKSADLIYQKISETPHLQYIIHGFNGSIEMINQFSLPNVYFSLGAGIFKNGNKTIAMLKHIPLNKLFFETDNSVIPMEKIYDRFCVVRKCTLSELKKQITENFEKVFNTHGKMD